MGILKIKDEDYRVLHDAIKEVENKYNGAKKVYIINGFSPVRYRWDLLWGAKLPKNFITKKLYAYMDDNHIDSALRRITNTGDTWV